MVRAGCEVTVLAVVVALTIGLGPCPTIVLAGDCPLPDFATQPVPVDGADSVPVGVSLSWIDGSSGDGGAAARPKLIYGFDDRREEYDVADPNLLDAGDSTAVMVFVDDLTDNGDGTYTLDDTSWAHWYENRNGRPLCDDEPFREQLNPGICSANLVGRDLVATAGHCIAPESCAEIAFVFGFVMLDETTPVVTVDASEVYFCSEVVDRRLSGHDDWAIVRLDRPVPNHRALPVRRDGEIGFGDPLVVIGYPQGIPRKYAGGATVRERVDPVYFASNLDTYGGNSGSAVFHADTLIVEGLLIAGNDDFVSGAECDRSNVCLDSGCFRVAEPWEIIVRATQFSHLLPSFDVYLGTASDVLELVGEGIGPTRFSPGELLPETTYFWRVDPRDSCGVTEGPVWSFTTGLLPSDVVPGDCSGEGVLDFSDAICLLGYVFLGDPPALPCGSGGVAEPSNVDLLDWLGDGTVDFTDAISLLTFVFLGGPPHILAVPGAETTGCVSIPGCPATCD